MRVHSATQKNPVAASATRRASAPGFAVATESADKPAAAAALRAVQTVESLLALQGVEDAAERRRRLVGRGRSALDLLDLLKLEILEGRVGPDTLRKLEVSLAGLSERAEEASLDQVLRAIGVRVAVELAKRRTAAATA